MAFPVYRLDFGWAMWMLWGAGYFRRMTGYFPTKAEAQAARMEISNG